MIQANELRIGNWVNIGEVAAIVTGDLIHYLEKNAPAVKFNPISLTPEILEKAGFDDISDYSQNEYNISVEDFGVITLRNDSDYKTWWVKNVDTRNPIKHLHQLQNLYFALTGEELQIKELVS